MRNLDPDEVRASVTYAEAIDALAGAFGTGDPSATPLRSSVETASGAILLMPAAGPDAAGVKLVTLTPGNAARGLPLINALYVLFDGATQAPVAVLDGAALTALRTSAVSALATRSLARPDAARLVVFGAGVQASAHVDAMRAVLPIEHVTVVGRDPEAAAALVERIRADGLEASVGDAGSVTDADVVCTCTTSTTPLFDGATLPPGCHVNAIGAYRPDDREVDTTTVRRARVVVETREVAAEEAGDLLIPIAEGAIGWDHVEADLAELVRGREVRRSRDDVTLFVSVGLAFEDLAVATAIVPTG
jgi:ornithine cyclodeaminase/alanine dehydrogenase-like protein (mu-crystallin family)